jgi:hypothetical protein
VGRIVGDKVYNHAFFEAGSEISTSPLLYLVGDGPGTSYAKTATGSWYRLMQPDAKYAAWMAKEDRRVYFPEGIHQNHHHEFVVNRETREIACSLVD